MRVAICGYPPLAQKVQDGLANSGIDFKFFVSDFLSNAEGMDFTTNLQPIKFFEFRQLVNAGEIDGLIIAENSESFFTKNVIQTCKLNNIPKVGIADLIHLNPFNPVHMLDQDKTYIPYLETNLVDGCNLNCKGCTHYSNLFKTNEVYPIETFRRDVRRLSQICDLRRFRLLGGEPLLLKNLDEYLKVAREYLPKTHLQIVTNGTLIPSLSQKILDAIRENNCDIDISPYQPTLKVADKIKDILTSNKIVFYFNYVFNRTMDKFNVFLTLHPGNNPIKARSSCSNDVCRFLRDGKIYKCPVDALSYRLVEKFRVKSFAKATSVDIYAENFSSLLPMLDGNVEMCNWCAEKNRLIEWKPTNNPKLEDWLADPAEIQKFK